MVRKIGMNIFFFTFRYALLFLLQLLIRCVILDVSFLTNSLFNYLQYVFLCSLSVQDHNTSNIRSELHFIKKSSD